VNLYKSATPICHRDRRTVCRIGAALRIWGTAYLGSATMLHGQMQAGAGWRMGPTALSATPLHRFRGSMVAAMCFIMPPTGALMTMIVLSIFSCA